MKIRSKVQKRVSAWLAAGLWLALMLPCAAPAAAELTPAEAQQLSRFAGVAGLRDVQDWARAKKEAEVQRSYQDARALFAGRGPDIARYYLTHTEVPPANDAYFFVLEAIADTDTALTLIRALWAPLKVESGAVLKTDDRTWIRQRDNFEIPVAIESVFVNDAVRSDPRTVAALVEAIARLREKPHGAGLRDAGTVVSLLARCAGPQTTAALQKLAADPEASIRSLAIEALGRTTAATAQAATTGQDSAFATFARALRADPQERTRLEAANALGKLGAEQGIALLREALATERHPEVVDAIVLALEQLKAPLTEPQHCREVVGRTWELRAARTAFACWHANASRESVLEAATRGPAQLRALALNSLIERTSSRRREPLVTFVPHAVPKPPPAPPGAQAITSVPMRPQRREDPPQAAFDSATRDRLLVSAVEVLSKPSAAVPGKSDEISNSTARLVRDAMWQISGPDMNVALAYADRIAAPRARYSQGRYGASYDLSYKNKAAYADYRRPRQAAAAGALALGFCILLVWRRTRRPGAILVLAALAWGVASLFATGVRELPPPPLQFLGATAIAFLSAGASVAWLAQYSQGRADTTAKTFGRAGAAVPLAMVLAFFACGFTRWNDIYPIGGEGWELIFDPIGSAVIAAVVAVGLAVVDGIFLRRLIKP